MTVFTNRSKYLLKKTSGYTSSDFRYWKRRAKIQEFFLLPISQHYNANLLPHAKGPTLSSQQSLTYIFYARVGSHDIYSPLREDFTSNVTTDDCDKRWPELIFGVQAQAGPQLSDWALCMMPWYCSINLKLYNGAVGDNILLSLHKKI